MDLHGWVDAYLDHLRVERALSPRSVEAYASDLGKLCAHAEAESHEAVNEVGDCACAELECARAGAKVVRKDACAHGDERGGG